MSMSLLTLFQFLQTLTAYLLVTLALPCVFLHKELSQYRFMNRVLLYYIIGNFYATNLVFLLQLLHISNYFTLWIGLLVVPAVIWEWRNQFPLLDRLRSLRHSGQKVLAGTLGIRNTIDSLWKKARKRCIEGLERVGKHWLDWLLILLLVLMVLWVYGVWMLRTYGYAASDIPVHMYWVNGMSENHIFVAGIYPHGMHAIIYLLNELFWIDTYVLFRVFALVQCLAIHMMVLLFLRLCCKSRFAAYVGAYLYAIGDFFIVGDYLSLFNLRRLLATLPQETSMIYILPTAYFAVYFFQEKRRELKEFKEAEESEASEKPEESEEPEGLEGSGEPEGLEGSGEPEGLEELEESDEAGGLKSFRSFRGFKKSRKSNKPKKKIPAKTSRMALAGLVMSFSLCVTAHFYGAIIAALFCIGIGIGYAGWLVRPIYFNRIVAAGLISLATAVLPMAIAFAMGTPLQGSLGWATEVITSSITQEEEQESEPEQAPSAQPENTQGAGPGNAAPGSPADGTDGPSAAEAVPSVPKFAIFETIKRFYARFLEASGDRLVYFTLGNSAWWYSAAIRVMILFLTVAGALLLLTPERMYGAMLLSTGIFMFLMLVMFSAAGLGLPSLMDPARANEFFTYLLVLVVGFTVDVCIFAVTWLFMIEWTRDVLSFAAVVVFLTGLWQQGKIRPTLDNAPLESNEAIICLTNIIATEPDHTWTIFSANDETQMVFGHGYHYELSTFLSEIEILDGDGVTIPTRTIYFFIEKIPLDFWTTTGGRRLVSEEGAQKTVSSGKGLSIYQGENRWIIMSRMYYWAREFQRLYPNEMTVYLETDNFICYRLEQNTYRLYNLAIDYGYNNVRPEEL